MTRRRVLLESEYGIYPQPSEAEKEDLPTAEDELPVAAGPQMSVQLSVQRPPIEDDEFTPGSIEELSRSASALAELVPSSQIEFFYKQLHKMLDHANDKAHKSEDEIDTMDSEDDAKPKPREGFVKEESVRRVVKRTLLEMLSDEDVEEFDKYRTGGVDYFGGNDSEPVTDPSCPDAVGLEDLAAEFGYSGAPGIRQEIERITTRMEHFASEICKDDLDALRQFAAGEYVDVMSTADLLDPEDIVELQQAPAAVESLDSFRFFFVSAFILPAYKEASREAGKNVKSEIANLGFPKELHQTIFNQVAGKSKGGIAVLKRKVDSLVKKGTISADEAKDVISTVRSAMPALKKAAEISDDLVELSLSKWNGMSKKKRAELLTKSLEQTAEFQG